MHFECNHTVVATGVGGSYRLIKGKGVRGRSDFFGEPNVEVGKGAMALDDNEGFFSKIFRIGSRLSDYFVTK